ncbi:hypothetical protein AAVH_21465 [Aphelenchoides avenae]|nr:hypothetical protein AAVH_21465 [Aphelenchus avenae]
MPLVTDVLIEVFGFLHRPTISLFREVCDHWRITIDAASNALLPLHNITQVNIKQTRNGLGMFTKLKDPLTSRPDGDDNDNDDSERYRLLLNFALENRDTSLDKGIERMQNLLRDAFVASFRIQFFRSASTSLALVRQQLHNCHVNAVFLDCWDTADVEKAIQTLSANWGVERFTLRIDISHLEGFLVNNVFHMDCVQRSKRLCLVLTMLSDPVRLTSDWISALRTLGECKQLHVKYHVSTYDGDEAVVDTSGIESIVKDILEYFTLRNKGNSE